MPQKTRALRHKHRHSLRMPAHRSVVEEHSSQDKRRTDVEMLDIKPEVMDQGPPAGRAELAVVAEEGSSMSATTEVSLTSDVLRGLKISLAALRWTGMVRLRGMVTTSQAEVTE